MPSLQSVTADFLDDAPFRVITHATVLAPIGECWSLLADQKSWPQWFPAMSSVEANPQIWTEPGQTRSVVVNRMKVDETAISIQPEAEYAFMITRWPLPVAVSAAEGIRLEDRTNRGSPRTRLTYIGAFELTAFGRFGSRLLEKQMLNTWEPVLKGLGKVAREQAAAKS